MQNDVIYLFVLIRKIKLEQVSCKVMEKAKGPGSTQMSFWHHISSRYDSKENAKNPVFVCSCLWSLSPWCLPYVSKFLLGIVRGKGISSSAEWWLRPLHSFLFLLQKSTFNSHPVEGKAILKHLEKIDLFRSLRRWPRAFNSPFLKAPTDYCLKVIILWELNGNNVCLVLPRAKSGEHVTLIAGWVGSRKKKSIR